MTKVNIKILPNLNVSNLVKIRQNVPIKSQFDYIYYSFTQKQAKYSLFLIK